MESERSGVLAEMEKNYKLYVGDQISQEGFGRTYRSLEDRMKALDDQLPRLRAELDLLRIQNLSRDEIVAEAQDLYGRWAGLLPDEKLQIVENVVERISIGKGEVSIDLAYIPSHSEITTKRQRGHRDSSRLSPADHANVSYRRVRPATRPSTARSPRCGRWAGARRPGSSCRACIVSTASTNSSGQRMSGGRRSSRRARGSAASLRQLALVERPAQLVGPRAERRRRRGIALNRAGATPWIGN